MSNEVKELSAQDRRLKSIALLLQETYRLAKLNELTENSFRWFNLMILYIATEFALYSGENKSPTREELQSFLRGTTVDHSTQQKMLDYYQCLLNNRFKVYDDAPHDFLDNCVKAYNDDNFIDEYLRSARIWLNHKAANVLFSAMKVEENTRIHLINQLNKKLRGYELFKDIFEIFGVAVPEIITSKINAIETLKNELKIRTKESVKDIVNSLPVQKGVLSMHTIGYLWRKETKTAKILDQAIAKEESLVSASPSLKRSHHR